MPEILDQGFFDENHPSSAGDFEFYRDFFNGEQADSFAELLHKHNIPYKLEKSQTLLEGTITGYGLVPHSVLKLRATDFSVVNQLLEENARNDLHFISNHYFHDFKAAELLEVVQKPDEWTPEDVAVAHHLLENQGVLIPKQQIADFRQQRLETLMEGRKASSAWISIYLLFVVVGGFTISPFFLVGGLGMGWYFWKDTTLDTYGNKYFTFDEPSRNAGQLIFVLGWVALVLAILFVIWLPRDFRLF